MLLKLTFAEKEVEPEVDVPIESDQVTNLGYLMMMMMFTGDNGQRAVTGAGALC
jgi:hypothetical protein